MAAVGCVSGSQEPGRRRRRAEARAARPHARVVVSSRERARVRRASFGSNQTPCLTLSHSQWIRLRLPAEVPQAKRLTATHARCLHSEAGRFKLSVSFQPTMSDDNKPYDPFKPTQPNIPGVPTRTGRSVKTLSLKFRLSQMQMPPRWLTVTIVAAIVVGIGVAWLGRDRPAEEAAPARVRASVPRAVQPAAPAEQLPFGPGPIATTDELTKVWSSKRFIYRDQSTGDETKAIVVKMPGGTLWGLLLREPFGTCDLEYVADMEKLKTQYHYRADHPMIGDPCSRTVFDLSRFGTNSAGGLVRGQVTQGSAIRPPIAIEIRTSGNQVIAGRME